MSYKIFNKVSAYFSDAPSDTAVAPMISDDGKIKFNDSNKRIFNTFFTVITVSTFVAMLGIILYYVFAYASLYKGSSNFDWLLGIFSDFVVIMNFSLEESPYVVGDSSYPPIAIAILYPFALMCKDIFAVYRYSELTAEELTAELTLYPQFWIALVLFFVICSVAIVLLTSRLFGLVGKDRLKIGVIIILSAPFVYAIMRGNTIYFALIALLLFLVMKDSENPFVRELALFFLALAGAIKIYPLFFGVFLLKDKKIFASIRVAFYFAMIFGLSFFFFGSDLNNFSPFLDRLGGFMSNELRLLGPTNLSISAFIYKFLHLFVPKLSSDSLIFTLINLSALIVVFAFSTFCAIVAKNDFSRYVICFAIITLIPSISYFYIIIFAILPFLEYIRSYSSMSMQKRIFYFAAFLFLFVTAFLLVMNYIVHSLVILSILTVEIISVIKETVKKSNS